MKKHAFPSSVKISYVTYKIEFVQPSSFICWDGMCAHNALTIFVKLNNDIANTLLHEILHAIWYQYQIKDEDKEERIVHTTANGLCFVMQANPDVFAWIQSQLDNGK